MYTYLCTFVLRSVSVQDIALSSILAAKEKVQRIMLSVPSFLFRFRFRFDSRHGDGMALTLYTEAVIYDAFLIECELELEELSAEFFGECRCDEVEEHIAVVFFLRLHFFLFRFFVLVSAVFKREVFVHACRHLFVG